MSNYAKADTRTQWFADNYPGARITPNCGVLHTTEGTGWPDYGGGKSAPNYTARPDFANKRLLWRAHFPDEMSARALMNQAGGVETNTANAVQVELVGTCDPKRAKSWNGDGRYLAGTHYIYWPAAPDWAKRDVAAFLKDMNTRHRVALAGPTSWLPYPKSYGSAGGQRMTHAQWREFYGWCGHQHVPENDHGDPGALDFAGILALAKGATTSPTASAETPALQEAGLAADDAQNVKDYVRALLLDGYTTGGVEKPSILDVLVNIQGRFNAQNTQIAALSAAVKALASAQGLDAVAVQASVDAAVKEALSDITLTVTPKAG